MILDIAHINGVSVARQADDPETWRVRIDTEELGTHSTVLLQLSLQSSAILRDTIDRAIRTAGTQTDDAPRWPWLRGWWKRHCQRETSSR